jgi:hypothetical protein
MHEKYLDFLLYQELLSDHLLKDRPKFHMALARRVRVHGMLQLLGKMHKQLWQSFRDCDGADRARHQDGKTSHLEARGMNLGTAIPIHLPRDGVIGIFQPFAHCTTAP